MKERIGLVTEGSTDLVVMSIFLPKAVAWLEAEHLVTIQPNADRTSVGSSPRGGWGKVQKWCIANPPELRRQIVLGGGLFEDSEPGPSLYDSIIIQLDADICEEEGFQKQSSVDANNYDFGSSIDRGSYLTAVISDWLWPDGNVDDDESWTIIGPAVEAIETWLVAGLTDLEEPESLIDLKKEFVTAVFESEGLPVPREAKNIRKRVSRYEPIAKRAANNIANVIDKCPHFSSLVDSISDL